MSEELKPCPWCPPPTNPTTPYLPPKLRHDWRAQTYQVVCPHCYGCGPLCGTEELAHRFWNTRPFEDALRAHISELEAENRNLLFAIDNWKKEELAWHAHEDAIPWEDIESMYLRIESIPELNGEDTDATRVMAWLTANRPPAPRGVTTESTRP